MSAPVWQSCEIQCTDKVVGNLWGGTWRIWKKPYGSGWNQIEDLGRSRYRNRNLEFEDFPQKEASRDFVDLPSGFAPQGVFPGLERKKRKPGFPTDPGRRMCSSRGFLGGCGGSPGGACTAGRFPGARAQLAPEIGRESLAAPRARPPGGGGRVP